LDTPFFVVGSNVNAAVKDKKLTATVDDNKSFICTTSCKRSKNGKVQGVEAFGFKQIQTQR